MNYLNSTEYFNTDISKSLEICKRKKIKYVIINFRGNVTDNIDFLQECSKHIEKLHINNSFIANVDVIYKLEKLKEFSISNASEKIKIDFSKLTNLESFTSDFYKGFTNIEKLVNLKKIDISKFPFPDLKMLESLTKLEAIILYRSRKLKSLQGIENLKKIKVIDLDCVPNLETLEGLTENHKELIKFRLYNAKRLSRITQLKNAVNLKHLQLTKLESEVEPEAKNLMENFKKLEIVGVNYEPKDFPAIKIKEVKENPTHNNGNNSLWQKVKARFNS